MTIASHHTTKKHLLDTVLVATGAAVESLKKDSELGWNDMLDRDDGDDEVDIEPDGDDDNDIFLFSIND